MSGLPTVPTPEQAAKNVLARRERLARFLAAEWLAAVVAAMNKGDVEAAVERHHVDDNLVHEAMVLTKTHLARSGWAIHFVADFGSRMALLRWHPA